MTDAVTSARLVRLLQLQLEARSRKRSKEATSDPEALIAPAELHDLVRRAGGNDQSRDDLRRAVIEHLLASRLGQNLRTEPKFRQLLERVRLTLTSQRELSALLDRTIDDIIAG